MSEEIQTLRAVAERALKFQQYMLRRAWGLYFVLWLAIPYSISILYPDAGFYPYLIAYSIPGIIGILATSWIFSRARRTIELRHVTSGLQRRRNFSLIAWLIFFAILISSIAFSRSTFYFVYSAFLMILDYFIYKSLKYSFPKIPVEGYVAIATFTSSVAVTAISFIFTQAYYILALGWFPSIAGWLFSSIYSLYHAPESMVE